MEKFKKLNRAEMKMVSGGQLPCVAGDYVKCDCGCLVVDVDCESPAAICGASGCSSISGGCFGDDVCDSAVGGCTF